MFPGCPKHCTTEGTLSKYSWNIACRLRLSCNSSLKSHRSSHHRWFTKKQFLKIFAIFTGNTCVFNKVAGLHKFLETYYKIKKKTWKWFFLKAQAWKHVNYVCLHKLILATSNMAEGVKQYVHFRCWMGLSAHTRRKNYIFCLRIKLPYVHIFENWDFSEK